MGREENIIQEKAEPVYELTHRPDDVKKQEEDNALAGQPGGGVFRLEKGSVGGTPEEAKIEVH
jgi:hypothetical protein